MRGSTRILASCKPAITLRITFVGIVAALSAAPGQFLSILHADGDATVSTAPPLERQADNPAGNPPPSREPAVADSATAELLDHIDNLMYEAARSGAREIHLRGVATAKLPLNRSFDSKVEIDWDGRTAPRKFAAVFDAQEFNQFVTAGAVRVDWLEESISRRPWRERYAGSRFTSSADGGLTTIHAEGENPEGLQSMLLDSQGLPKQLALRLALPGTTAVWTMDVKIEMAELDGKFARKRILSSGQGPGGKKLEIETVFEYRKEGACYLIAKYETVARSDPGASKPGATKPAGSGMNENFRCVISFNEFFVDRAPAAQEPQKPTTKPHD